MQNYNFHIAKGIRLRISHNLMAKPGTALSDVKEIVNAYLAVGIHEISLSDASGQAYPTQVYSICTEMAKAYPQVTWWLHFHNTRGLASQHPRWHAGRLHAL